jgi:hypothetical protein
MSIFKKKGTETDSVYRSQVVRLLDRVNALYAHFGLKEGLVSTRQDFNYAEPEESVRRIVAEEKKK